MESLEIASLKGLGSGKDHQAHPASAPPAWVEMGWAALRSFASLSGAGCHSRLRKLADCHSFSTLASPGGRGGPPLQSPPSLQVWNPKTHIAYAGTGVPHESGHLQEKMGPALGNQDLPAQLCPLLWVTLDKSLSLSRPQSPFCDLMGGPCCVPGGPLQFFHLSPDGAGKAGMGKRLEECQGDLKPWG